MNREQMIDATDQIMNAGSASGERAAVVARQVLDAILPQVTTVAELEALPFATSVIDSDGEAWTRYHLSAKGVRPLRWRNPRGSYGWTSERLAALGPLTVVWQPEVQS